MRKQSVARSGIFCFHLLGSLVTIFFIHLGLPSHSHFEVDGLLGM